MDNIPVKEGRLRDVMLDAVGPLEESNGFTHLLTMINRVTNYVTAAPLATTTAKACVDAFMHHYYGRYGLPVNLTLDRGTNFTSDYWNDFQTELGIDVKYTPRYHPEALGSMERQHRDLKVGLRVRLIAAGGQWMDHPIM